MDSAPKTKGNVKAIMHHLYEKAMLWECSRSLCGAPEISTTMNVYGNALMEAKRETNGKVVRKALRSA